MFRATSFLIVFALAGAPAASLACDLWCTNPSAEKHRRLVGCHSDSADASEGQPQVASISTECHDALSGTLFLTDSRNHIPSATTLSMTPHVLPPLNGDAAPPRAHVFDAPLPRAPLRSVLRL